MTYQRKTVDYFEIQGKYSLGWETVTWDTTLKEARQTLKDYNDNEPAIPHRIKKTREYIQKP